MLNCCVPCRDLHLQIESEIVMEDGCVQPGREPTMAEWAEFGW